MAINLNDWFGTHLWLMWVTVAVLLVALELLRRDRTMLVLGIGSLAAALTALVLRQEWWWQLVVGLVVSVAGLYIVSRRRRPGGRPATEPPPSA